MEFDFQWLLLGLPIAFALGWIASRLDVRQWRREERASPRAYYKGLNLLLNEQQDKAIDAFIEAVQHDPGAADLHFALGNLFRRRGEYDRAIRMHQNLLERADLGAEQKLRDLAGPIRRAAVDDRRVVKLAADLDESRGLVRLPADALDVERDGLEVRLDESSVEFEAAREVLDVRAEEIKLTPTLPELVERLVKERGPIRIHPQIELVELIDCEEVDVREVWVVEQPLLRHHEKVLIT
jgi:tetratricopeptide (TPR) repeat protein